MDDAKHLADDEDFDVRSAEEGEFGVIKQEDYKPLEIKLPPTYLWGCPKGHKMLGGESHFLIMVSVLDGTVTSRACPACIAIYLNENFPQMEKKEKDNAKE